MLQDLQTHADLGKMLAAKERLQLSNSHPDDISNQAQPSLLSAHLSSSIPIILIALCLRANSQTVVTSHHLLRLSWLVSGSLSDLLSGIFGGAAPLVVLCQTKAR